MINFIGILILLFIEATLIMSAIAYYQHKLNIKDEELLARDKLLGEFNEIIKNKNLQIKELQDELERKNNTRSRKNN